jgi:hypothetical protein
MKQARSASNTIAVAAMATEELRAGTPGKAAAHEQPSSLSSSEEHILRCLGAAVIDQWTTLPTNVQRVLFDRAAALGAPRHVLHLKEQIASFLRSHRNDKGSVL